MQGTPILQATGANRAQINGTVVVPLTVCTYRGLLLQQAWVGQLATCNAMYGVFNFSVLQTCAAMQLCACNEHYMPALLDPCRVAVRVCQMCSLLTKMTQQSLTATVPTSLR